MTSVVTSCVLETDTEDKAGVAGEVTTLVLTSVSEDVTEGVIWDVPVISVMRDSGGRSVAGIRVAVDKRGSVDVVFVGAGVDSAVVCSVWGLLGAVLSVCVFPKLTSAIEVDSVRAGTLTGRECGWVLPVFVKAAAALGVVVQAVLTGVISMLLTGREDGVILVWIVDILGCAWVEVGVTTDEPLFPVNEEGRSVAVTGETSALGEDSGIEASVSMVPGVLDVLWVE